MEDCLATIQTVNDSNTRTYNDHGEYVRAWTQERGSGDSSVYRSNYHEYFGVC